jgi:hypothetical protein
MNTTLEKLQAEVEAEIKNSPESRIKELEIETYQSQNSLYTLSALLMGVLGLAYLLFNIRQNTVFSNTLGIDVVIIISVALSALMLIFLPRQLKRYNKKVKKLKISRSSDSAANRETNRERFWTELGVMLDKDYEVLLPIAQQKDGDKFKSPADAPSLKIMQEINGAQGIVQLENLVPYLVGSRIIKQTPSD